MGREGQPSTHHPSFLRRPVDTFREFRQSNTAIQTSAMITLLSLLTSATIGLASVFDHNEILLDTSIMTGLIGAIGYIDTTGLQRRYRRNKFSETQRGVIDLNEARQKRREGNIPPDSA